MSRNEQPPTFRNAACGDQILTIKHSLQDCPQWRDSRKKYNIQGWHKDPTGKGLWNGEDDEVPYGVSDIWGNIQMTGGWRDQHFILIDEFDPG